MTAEKIRSVVEGLKPEDAPHGTGLWEVFREGQVYLCMDCGPNDDGREVFTFAVFSDRNPDEIIDVAGQYIFLNGALVGVDGLSTPDKELLSAWQQAEKQ